MTPPSRTATWSSSNASRLGPELLLELVRANWAPNASEVEYSATPLRGGIDAASVQRIVVRYRDARGQQQRAFVLKSLNGNASREAELYESWVRYLPRRLRPEMLGAVWQGRSSCLLMLEFIRPSRRWPWGNVGTSTQLLQELAGLHRGAPPRAFHDDWDYTAELRRSGQALLAFLQGPARAHPDFRYAARFAAPVRTLLHALPAIRRQLLDCRLLPASVIHGDVHPGNALQRAQKQQQHPVLIDWGRARLGSPLEDVSSWLQSLGYWEPVAKRRHDTLLRQYLVARGARDHLDSDLRGLYWSAAACNVLAGAALHHLSCANGTGSAASQRRAHHAAYDALRILRRAAACWGAER